MIFSYLFKTYGVQLLAFSGFGLLLSSLCVAQEQRPRPAKPKDVEVQSNGKGVLSLRSPAIVVSSDVDYLIGHNDILDIKVQDAKELTGEYRVNSQGVISLPVLGKIEAGGRTAEEIVKAISNRLRGDYLTDPVVLIKVLQSNSRAFFIHGAVLRPGTYQIEGNVSLLKLISIAGGLTGEHGAAALIIRETNKEKSSSSSVDKTSKSDVNASRVTRVNLDRLLKGDFENDITVHHGDVVYIRASEMFFVSGAVRRPGTFPLKKNTTVLHAIALAGGLSQNAGSTVFLTRERIKSDTIAKSLKNKELKRKNFEIIKIDIGKMFRGELERVLVVRPGDFIHIARAGGF